MRVFEEQFEGLTQDSSISSAEYDYTELVKTATRLGKEALESYGERGSYFKGEYLDILIETSLGQKDEEISRKIHRSVSTVSVHRSKTIDALAAKNIEDAIRISFYMGLLPPEESMPNESQFKRPLTKLENRVLQLIAEGTSTELIAEQLQCGQENIRHTVGRILTTLGAKTRIHAVRIGLENGLVDVKASPSVNLGKISQVSARASSLLLGILPSDIKRGVRDELRRAEAISSNQSPSERLIDLLIDREGQLVFYEEAASEIYSDEDGPTPGSVKIGMLAKKPELKRKLLGRGYSFDILKVTIDPAERKAKTAKLTRAAMICIKIEVDSVAEPEVKPTIEYMTDLIAAAFRSNRGDKLSAREIGAITGLDIKAIRNVLYSRGRIEEILAKDGLVLLLTARDKTPDDQSIRAYICGSEEETILEISSQFTQHEIVQFQSEAIRAGRKLASIITHKNVKGIDLRSLRFTLASESVLSRLLSLKLISQTEFEEGSIGVLGAASLHLLTTEIGQKFLELTDEDDYRDELREIVMRELREQIDRLRDIRR